MRLSILDDYQGVALGMADWTPVKNRGVEIAVERHAFADEDAAVRALAPVDSSARDRGHMRYVKAQFGLLLCAKHSTGARARRPIVKGQ